MHRLFIDRSMTDGQTVTVRGDDARHIGFSLRMRCGEKISCACEGRAYLCEIVGFTSDSVSMKILSEEEGSEPPVGIILYQALLKGDALDGVFRRAVECGATEIVPFSSSHCIAKAGDGFDKRMQRLEKIVREAAMQSARTVIPRLRRPVGFSEAIREMSSLALPLICHEGEDTQPIGKILAAGKSGSIGIAIGPEGGFSDEEVNEAKNLGVIPCGLGKRILRAETASAFAISCVSCIKELS